MSKLKFIFSELNSNANKVINKNKYLVIIDMIFSGIIFGASPSNYVLFDFVNASYKERKTYYTHRDNNIISKKYNNVKSIYKLENKIEFAKKFSKYYKRNFYENRNMTLTNLTKISTLNKVIYKPIMGGQGRGIKIFEINDNYSKILKEIKKLPYGIVEEWIEQHEKMSLLYPKSVNPIRIQTIVKDGKVNVLAANLAIGNGTDFANASTQHSIFALIDCSVGKVISDGCDYDGYYFDRHPTTNVKIKDFQIPYWEEILEMISSAALELSDIRHIGWDVAITKSGPCIIEGNNDPGYTAYQLPLLNQKRVGIKEKYKPYL